MLSTTSKKIINLRNLLPSPSLNVFPSFFSLLLLLLLFFQYLFLFSPLSYFIDPRQKSPCLLSDPLLRFSMSLSLFESPSFFPFSSPRRVLRSRFVVFVALVVIIIADNRHKTCTHKKKRNFNGRIAKSPFFSYLAHTHQKIKPLISLFIKRLYLLVFVFLPILSL